jgi:putative membrane protein
MKRPSLFVALMLPVAAVFAAAGATDQNFVEEAAQGGIAEVELGRLAAQKGGSEHVRSFGQQMVTDHEPNNQKLKTLAMGKGLKVPSETDVLHRGMKKKLEGLSGAEFDKMYLQGQVADHEKMVTLMKRTSESASDPELKAFAAQTLPVVQKHLDMAKQMAKGGMASH